MIFKTQVPIPPLDQFIEFLWFYDDFAPLHSKEKLLPDGSMDLIIDLREEPKHVFDRNDFSSAKPYRRAWLSGMHHDYIVIDAVPGSMMGVHFRAGGAWPFFSRPLSEFTDDVVELDCVVGSAATELRERLLEAATPERKLALLERWLLAAGGDRLQPNPAVDFALDQMMSLPVRLLVREMAAKVGISQKHLIHLFDSRIGMTPKQLDRVFRFNRVIKSLAEARPGEVDWAAVALDCGYYDQAHFIHEFREFSGITPTAYLTHARDQSNFLILDPPSATPQ